MIMSGVAWITSGQARKSLWIETTTPFENVAASIGQARKSLWIETPVFEAASILADGSGS